MPPEQMNGGLPEDQSETPEVDAAVEALLGAAVAGAHKAATSEDPEAFMRFGQGAFFFTQAIEKLLPPKPDPNVQMKVEGDVIKAGAQHATELEKQSADHAVAKESADNGSGQGRNM